MSSLHELASLEGRDILGGEFEPLALLPFRLEPLVPVCLDTTRVVSPNYVNPPHGFGELYVEFVLPSSSGVGFPNFVKTA